jgi:hypothetical protein
MARRISRTTTDHDTIRGWAEKRGGWPAEVVSAARGSRAGTIRIDLPGHAGVGKDRRIAWDEWFRKFDEASLAFTYEETTTRGQRSNFNRLVGREAAKARAVGQRASRRELRAEKRGGTSATSRARRIARRAAAVAGARRAARAAGRRQASRAETARTASRRSKRATGRGRPTGGRGKGRSATRRGTTSRRGGGRATRRPR